LSEYGNSKRKSKEDTWYRPDDSSFADIQYHIYVCSKIEQGLKDIEEGSMLSLEEVERKMTKKII